MADGIDFDLSNIFKGIDFVSDRVRDAAERGMQKAMEDLAEASDQEAPKLTGELRSSRKVDVKATGFSVTGTVTYNAISKNKRGWGYNYALRLHEMGAYKDPSTPNTKPKFLSRPLKARRVKYEQMIADEIRKELR